MKSARGKNMDRYQYHMFLAENAKQNHGGTTVNIKKAKLKKDTP